MLSFIAGVIKAFTGYVFAFMAGAQRERAKDAEGDLEAVTESKKLFHRIRTDSALRKRVRDKFR